MKRRGELSMEVIIIAAIALLVLVILAVLVIRAGTGVGTSTTCTGVGGECVPDDCSPGKVPNPGLACPIEGDTCCIPIMKDDA